MTDRRMRRLLPVALYLLATACGGGGSGSDPSGPPPPPPPPPGVVASFINLESDAGDYIGAGSDYSYSKADAQITVTASGARLTISVVGDERWTGEFQLPNTYSTLQPGSYANLTRYPMHNPAVGGLSWSGEGRGCNTLTGWIIIDRVTYEGTTLSVIDLRFEQHCEGGAPALHGEIHWDVDDTTSPPGPVLPLPPGLWEPAAGVTPAIGDYIYLESEPGDYIGAGENHLYTDLDSIVTMIGVDNHLSVSVSGNEGWIGDFRGMYDRSRFQVGYYGDLQRYPFHNPVKGGLNWSGEGRGCNTVTGWFIVDDRTYDGATLTSIELRFEQHCEGGGPALRGKILWHIEDRTTPGPIVPPPSGLWEPATGVTPTTGNYIYLESESGDYIGEGESYLYTPADSVVEMSAAQGLLSISIDADEKWDGKLQGMNSLRRIEVGYYGDLEGYPFHDPVKGGLRWSVGTRSCSGTLTGWFVVDSVTYDGQSLIAVDLRFEQRCYANAPALRGAIHWNVNDHTISPPGPVVPPPADLWEPAPGVTPATGNYVYLESDAGDFVGAGGNYLYTPADSLMTATSTGAFIEVVTIGDEEWVGRFQGMYTLDRMEVGYYGDLQRERFHNPAKGGLIWFGEGRGCSRLTGWFVVDSVTYDGATLTAVDLRFEQHCDGGVPALRGAIHWDVDGNTTSPPGPVVPPPAGLWEPAPGATPAAGNYVYLESQPGDYIGNGDNYLYTPADTQITIDASGATLSVSVNGAESWNGYFQGMNTLSRLEAGYYGDLQLYPYHNPTKGGMDWYGESRGCSSISGWFVIDSVTYNGATLTAIDLRFEQYCDGRVFALHGEIHWSQ